MLRIALDYGPRKLEVAERVMRILDPCGQCSIADSTSSSVSVMSSIEHAAEALSLGGKEESVEAQGISTDHDDQDEI
jgi:hypothetical protein